MQDELFIVDYPDGELIDIEGDGGFSVFSTRADAQEALDSEIAAVGDRPTTEGLRIVSFVRSTGAVR